MPRWIWSLLALLIFLALFKSLIRLMILARLRLRPACYRAIGEAGVEPWELNLLRGAAGIMASQGFRFAGFARLPKPIELPSPGRVLAFYEHASEPVWASVTPADVPLPQCPFQINYVSCFTNGRLLHTRILQEKILPGGVGYAVEQEVAAADFDALFAAHRQAAAEMAPIAPAERIGFPALLFLGDKLLADHLESLRARGLVVRTGAGGYRLTLRGLWTANRTTAATAPPADRLRRTWASRKETFPVPPEAEAEAFLTMDAISPKLGNHGKGLLILASLAAFSLLSGGGFSWSSGAMLLAIVFIHEMGHALAMRWVGYRDVNVFFIPFFGAVATGRRERHPAAWKEAFVLLAGPVPGLFAGAAALWAGEGRLPEWAMHAAFTSVLVNGFNLLPIAPLDGGQLMQLIVFRRFPRLNKIFLALSAGAVAMVAWWAESPLLGFFALVLVWGLYRGGRREPGEIELAVIRARHGDGRDSAGRWDAGMIAEFFAWFRQGPALDFLEKVTRIKVFLAAPADGQAAPPAGPAAAAGLFAAYACVMLLPLGWYASSFLGGFLHSGKVARRADLSPAQARVYDGLCGDTAVYQISMISARDTLYLHAMVIAPSDTGRVKALAQGLAAREPVHVFARAPIWGFGGLDSTLLESLHGEGDPEEEETGPGDSSAGARYRALDSAGQAAWRDSAEAEWRIRARRLDSLRDVEAGIWESWPAQRRKEWLHRWKQKRARYDDGFLECFKG